MTVKVPQVDIVEACAHPKLLNIPLSVGQRMVLKSSNGDAMTDEETGMYLKASGRFQYAPGVYHRDVDVIAGRRFGKTHHVVVPQACYYAAFVTYENLRPGERPTIVIMSVSMEQAAIAWRGIAATFRNSPTLRVLVKTQRRMKLELWNGVDIIVVRCALREVRGFPIPFFAGEEAAFWRSEEDPTQNPAEEILAAVRPALLQFPRARQLLVSSTWSKSGPIWTDYSKRLQRDEPLVLKMSSPEGNPTLRPELLAAERERDPERYEREINAEFVDSAQSLLPGEALDRCVVRGRWEVPPKTGMQYTAGLDVAFRSDDFGFALSHAEGERVILDLVRSWTPKPGKPVQFASTMEEIVAICKHYGCTRAFSDQVANEVVKQYLAAAGIKLEQVSTLGRRASGIYATLRAKTLAGQIEFLDVPELLSQLRRLEIIRSSGGGERCEASSGHDDIAIAAALSIHQSVSRPALQPWAEVIQLRTRVEGDGPSRWWTKLRS
jgi:hypothetical protein